MEPKLDDSNTKAAPVVIWSTDSPIRNPSSPSSGIYQTANGTPCDVSSITKSNGSSGIGKDSPEKTTSDTVTYSPALSSIGDEPKLIDSPTKSIFDYSYTSNNNNISNDHGVKNGDINYISDGVKFVDPDGRIISVNKDDSICSSQDDDEDEEEVVKPKIPDGGWGWMVVFSSLLISMIADGISFSFGLLFTKFLEQWNETNQKTAWIGSLFMAVPLLSGPVMSAFVDRYGCKYMTILGGIISGTGFVLAAFGDSVEYEYMTFGVIAGLGLGLCYVTAVVSIAPWFDKYRTLANSLGACGTGFGTFVYAPMTQFFIEEFGWRGTVLMLAGSFFNFCVCGAVLREPEWWTIQQRENRLCDSKSVNNPSSCGSVSGLDGESQCPGVEEIRTMLKSGQSPEYILTSLVTSIKEQPEPERREETDIPTVFRSVVNLPTFVQQGEKVPLEVIQQLSSNTKIFNFILKNYPSLLHCKSMSDNGKLNQIPEEEEPRMKRVPLTMSMKVKAMKKKASIANTPVTINENHRLETAEACVVPLLPSDGGLAGVVVKGIDRTVPHMRRQMSVKDTGHYLRNIRVHRNSVMYRGAVLNLPSYRLRASSCPNIYRNSMTTIAKENEEKWYADALELIKGMFDFSMFLELHFLLMSLATILLFTWFIVPYFYLSEHIQKNGYTRNDGSYIISIVGITNCFSMVALGWAGDQPWMKISVAYSICLVLCGICTMLIPIITFSYEALLVVCASFGAFFASNYSFTPSILVELIPLERFATGYGLILLCQGIGNLIGPPIAGLLCDITGTWDLTFYVAGFWIMVSGLLVICIPYTKNRRIWGDGLLEMDKISNA